MKIKKNIFLSLLIVCFSNIQWAMDNFVGQNEVDSAHELRKLRKKADAALTIYDCQRIVELSDKMLTIDPYNYVYRSAREKYRDLAEAKIAQIIKVAKLETEDVGKAVSFLRAAQGFYKPHDEKYKSYQQQIDLVIERGSIHDQMSRISFDETLTEEQKIEKEIFLREYLQKTFETGSSDHYDQACKMLELGRKKLLVQYSSIVKDSSLSSVKQITQAIAIREQLRDTYEKESVDYHTENKRIERLSLKLGLEKLKKQGLSAPETLAQLIKLREQLRDTYTTTSDEYKKETQKIQKLQINAIALKGIRANKGELKMAHQLCEQRIQEKKNQLLALEQQSK